jgi:hypothetical protein
MEKCDSVGQKADVSSLRYSGDLSGLKEKVATLALNLYTIHKREIQNPFYNFFQQIYWSKILGNGKM